MASLCQGKDGRKAIPYSFLRGLDEDIFFLNKRMQSFNRQNVLEFGRESK